MSFHERTTPDLTRLDITNQVGKYLELVRRRACGEVQTAASWIRGFVQRHPEYQVCTRVCAVGSSSDAHWHDERSSFFIHQDKPSVHIHMRTQHDSVMSPSIAYDLLLECQAIGMGAKRCPALLGEDVVIEPIVSEVRVTRRCQLNGSTDFLALD